ncbi:hypothetical protein Q9L58_010020 [Maublancomyces gigas]|uniref:Transmembrane protein n=1 Tax=Discina gigas TaxID=1032678 RepID=A0ABR3G593_9PEZI
MDRIYVYVIASDKWYLQQTSGPVPSYRVWSCAVVAAAADNSSFQWIGSMSMSSLATSGISSRPPDPYRHIGFICTVVIDLRIKISRRSSITTTFFRSPKPSLECVDLFQILDLNTGKLITTFGDNKNYYVPSSVISSIGGGAQGGANITKPASGFAPDLEQELVTPVQTTISPSPSHTSLPPPVRPLGPIIGGTVGGVAFAVLLLCGFLFWIKRRETPAAGPSEAAATDVVNPTAYPSTEDRGEMDSGQDQIQSPVSPLYELPYSAPRTFHELPGKTEPVSS